MSDDDTTATELPDELTEDRPPATDVVVGGLAFDLVTRQLLLVRRRVADDLVAYYEREAFDLYNYGVHPYLPVTPDDPVYECVYVADESVQKLDEWGGKKTYDFPAGRLAVVPVMEAWTDAQ